MMLVRNNDMLTICSGSIRLYLPRILLIPRLTATKIRKISSIFFSEHKINQTTFRRHNLEPLHNFRDGMARQWASFGPLVWATAAALLAVVV